MWYYMQEWYDIWLYGSDADDDVGCGSFTGNSAGGGRGDDMFVSVPMSTSPIWRKR